MRMPYPLFAGLRNRTSFNTLRLVMFWAVVEPGLFLILPLCCYLLNPCDRRKTTTMIFKMLGIERTWDQNRDMFQGSISRPRQLFVTQSKVLAEKVEEYYAKLSQSLAAEQRSTQESSKLSTDKEQKGLVDRDEEDLYRGELPKRFGELEDSHFPLFLTYDQVSPCIACRITFI